MSRIPGTEEWILCLLLHIDKEVAPRAFLPCRTPVEYLLRRVWGPVPPVSLIFPSTDPPTTLVRWGKWCTGDGVKVDRNGVQLDSPHQAPGFVLQSPGHGVTVVE